MAKKRLRHISRIVIILGLASFACSNSIDQSSDGGEPTPTPTPLIRFLDSGSSGGETSSENGSESQSGESETKSSDIACLVGNWQVDNASYLAVLNTASGAAGEFSAINGVLGTIMDADGTVTNYTENFSMTLCSTAGCLDIPVEQSGTTTWEVDEDGLLAVGGGQLSQTSISGVTGEAVSEGGGSDFTCIGDNLTILMEGFPPLEWYRIE